MRGETEERAAKIKGGDDAEVDDFTLTQDQLQAAEESQAHVHIS
jgi:hypothetical protein